MMGEEHIEEVEGKVHSLEILARHVLGIVLYALVSVCIVA